MIGGEIANTRFRVRADDPADLGAPLSYAVRVLAPDDDEDLNPAAAALSIPPVVLAARRAGIQTALGEVEAAALAVGSEEGNGRAATGR